MLLSIDWDCYSGCAEYVFDAPIWGTPDRDYNRLDAWRHRLGKRGGSDWDALNSDFPLFVGWEALAQYAGVPAHMTLSHAQARDWLTLRPGREVLNLDSHHDLYSGSGDPLRWRPGNWAGLGLAGGLISHYTVRYPAWHEGLLVAEGHDLARTRAELEAATPGLLAPDLLSRVRLERGPALPPAEQVEGLLLVQSPSWCSPAHDDAFFELAGLLGAEVLGPPPLNRSGPPGAAG